MNVRIWSASFLIISLLGTPGCSPNKTKEKGKDETLKSIETKLLESPAPKTPENAGKGGAGGTLGPGGPPPGKK